MMKILKGILIGIVGVIALVLILALFAKKEMVVEKEIIINKPKQDVFAYIKLLKNQENYGKWNLMDVNMRKDYKGTDGTIGFVTSWDSDNNEVGKGEQEIKKIIEGERLDFELRFKKPMDCSAAAYMTTEAVTENQTKVKWGFIGNMKYPLNVMLLFIDGNDMMGKDFQAGLDNLKKVLEK